MLSGFPYGRTQHVRGMHSSIISVTYYVNFQAVFLYVVMSGSAACPFLVQKRNILFRITHRSVQQISSAVSKLQ